MPTSKRNSETHDLFLSILKLAETKLPASALPQDRLARLSFLLGTIETVIRNDTWEVTGPPKKLRYWRGGLCVEFSVSLNPKSHKMDCTISISYGPGTESQ